MPGDRGQVERFQTPEPGSGEIAGNAAHTEAIGSVLDAFHFVTEHREPLGYSGDRRLGLEMLLQPGQRRLHAFASMLITKISPHRRTPVPMAGMGPGLRREDGKVNTTVHVLSEL